MNTLMTRFMEIIKEHPIICGGLFEVRFVTTQANNAILVLVYKKPIAAGRDTP